MSTLTPTDPPPRIVRLCALCTCAFHDHGVPAGRSPWRLRDLCVLGAMLVPVGRPRPKAAERAEWIEVLARLDETIAAGPLTAPVTDRPLMPCPGCLAQDAEFDMRDAGFVLIGAPLAARLRPLCDLKRGRLSPQAAAEAHELLRNLVAALKEMSERVAASIEAELSRREKPEKRREP